MENLGLVAAQGRAFRRLFLSSEGHANSASGDGRCAPRSPRRARQPNEFVDDPMHPVPSLGGSCCSIRSPASNRVSRRVKTSSYTAATLFAQTTRLVGDVIVTLAVDSSAPDTDFVVKLLDVDADGHASISPIRPLGCGIETAPEQLRSCSPERPIR